ncbi:MAG: hypothetical protein GYA51_10470 [Candidatus Methanofastidiosa archaeon]|nr:hypothetical protein [Candidatus Methanofastidiosa archaeon]
MRLKRGDKSFHYLLVFFCIAFSIMTTIVSIIEIEWIYKLFLITILASLLMYFCFLNDWARNKIVGIVTKIQNKEERHDVD